MANAKIIDKRVRSEALEYAIQFAARKTAGSNDYDHAFLVWFYSDAQHRRTNRKGAGFYPVDGSAGIYDLLIGGTTGKVLDDSRESIAEQAVVLVNQDVFDAARAVQSNYDTSQTYRLGTNDCVSFIAAVAETVPGLSVPSRVLYPTPSRFVSALYDQN